ncbi:hypothetical protein IP88_09510 [alpha proteobacterium AAP81b]|nr:hypothetical protein IP88_09510 [alpha proteobacterium AAP81b]
MEGPETHVPHAPHTGHRWWDFAIGGAAMVVSLISLYVAVHHGEIMEKLVAANSWPNIDASGNVVEGRLPGSVRFEVAVRNNGVGPARVESLELWDGTTPIRDAAGLAARLKLAGGGMPLSARLEGASIIGQVVGARENVKVVAFDGSDAARWGLPMVQLAGQLETRVCYCSVFDECYVADSRANHGRAEHVEKCPAPAAAFDDDIGRTLLARQAPNAAVTAPTPPASVAK